uniref:Thioredoxin domain-containing protein 17 n=1 Tax=Falco tinnunculus TaxID=100819 RepID=A0A8C4V822_FALTI
NFLSRLKYRRCPYSLAQPHGLPSGLTLPGRPCPPAPAGRDARGAPAAQPCRRQPAAAASPPHRPQGTAGAGETETETETGPRVKEGEVRPAPAPGPTVQTRPWQPPPQRPPGSGTELRGATGAQAGRGGPALPFPAAAMGWEEKQVRGYPEFAQTAQRYHGRPIFALFCGDKDAEGRSWCPDCVRAEPVVRKELHNMPDESVFIYCLVGDRAYWKDPNNEFRKNLKLTGVPTLLKYGTQTISNSSSAPTHVLFLP